MSFFNPEALKMKVSVTSQSSAVSISTSFADIAGTSINYIPHSDSTHVVYSAAFAANTYTNASATTNIKLVTGSVGGSMSDYDNGTDNSFASTRAAYPHSSLITLQHEIPAWTGEKTLKLQIYGNSGVLHGSQYFDGSGTKGNYGFYHPNAMIYSIIK